MRCRQSGREDVLNSFLTEWERWAAELLENCLSFPLLAYYRSQHDNQSWLAALTAILDTCTLEICGHSDAGRYQARLTFAIARHAAVDISLVFRIKPVPTETNRLPSGELDRLRIPFQIGRPRLSRRPRDRGAPGRAAGHVRAVRQWPRTILPVPVARLFSRAAEGRQLADEHMDAPHSRHQRSDGTGAQANTSCDWARQEVAERAELKRRRLGQAREASLSQPTERTISRYVLAVSFATGGIMNFADPDVAKPHVRCDGTAS